jgi:pantoate--beta-alanine ligase
MSSRNNYLSPEQRRQATVLWRTIQMARSRVAKGPVSADKLKQELGRLIAEEPEARLDYIALCDPDTLQLAHEIKKGMHIALAVFIGRTRLIDNGKL